MSLLEAAFTSAPPRSTPRAALIRRNSRKHLHVRARTATVGSARSAPRSFISTGLVEREPRPLLDLSRYWLLCPCAQVVSHRDVNGFQWFIHLLADLEASAHPLAEGAAITSLTIAAFSAAPRHQYELMQAREAGLIPQTR